MKWLIVEDMEGPILNWLSVLKERGVAGAERLFLPLMWRKILKKAKESYHDSSPYVDLSFSFLDQMGCDALMKGTHLFGVSKGDIIILFIKTHEAVDDAIEWLDVNLPPSCLSFLDYTLAGDMQAELAERIAPLLAKSFNQLCVNHSSTRSGSTCHPYLGLEKSKRRFYKNLDRRLSENTEVAKLCVDEAVEYWESRNSSFSKDQDVDKVINLFVRSKYEDWDHFGPFHHNALQNPESQTYREITALCLNAEDDHDSLKGLFQCSAAMQRDEPGKLVELSDLKNALKFLGLENVSFDSEMTQKTNPLSWAPPFLPGVLLLCQIKLLMNAFSDLKEGRVPPSLLFARRSVTFSFNVDIEKKMKKSSKSGNSWKQMASLEKGYVDEHNVSWLSNTSANSIRDLLQPPSPESLSMSISKNEISFSWD